MASNGIQIDLTYNTTQAISDLREIENKTSKVKKKIEADAISIGIKLDEKQVNKVFSNLKKAQKEAIESMTASNPVLDEMKKHYKELEKESKKYVDSMNSYSNTKVKESVRFELVELKKSILERAKYKQKLIDNSKALENKFYSDMSRIAIDEEKKLLRQRLNIKHTYWKKVIAEERKKQKAVSDYRTKLMNNSKALEGKFYSDMSKIAIDEEKKALKQRLNAKHTYWKKVIAEERKNQKAVSDYRKKLIRNSKALESKFYSDMSKIAINEEKRLLRQKLSMKHAYLRKVIAAERKNQKAVSDYRKKLMRNSKALESKFYSDMSKIAIDEEKRALKQRLKIKHTYWKKVLAERRKQLKQIEAEAIASEKKIQKARARTLRGAIENGTTLGHKAYTTASYALVGAALFKVAEAMRFVVTESIAFDDAIYSNMAVLGATKKEATDLAESTREIGIAYGGTYKEIANVTLTLGRAGVATRDLASATQAVVEMATITGDSFSDSSEVMSTFITNFEGAGVSVEELANKLTFVANETKMSTKDLGTFANYGLITAKSMGLTINTVGALTATLSRLGFNASTIGTEMQKLDKIFNTSSTTVSRFWDIVYQGEDSKAKRESMVEAMLGGDEQVLVEFAQTLRDLPTDQFNAAIDGMEIRTKKMILALRSGSDMFAEYSKSILNAADASEQAAIKALGTTSILERAANKIGETFDGAVGWLTDAFTNRDEILALDADLRTLRKTLGENAKSTDEYIDKHSKMLAMMYDMGSMKNIDSMVAKLKTLNDAYKMESGSAKVDIYYEILDLTEKITEKEIAQNKIQKTKSTHKKTEFEIEQDILKEKEEQRAFDIEQANMTAKKIRYQMRLASYRARVYCSQ